MNCKKCNKELNKQSIVKVIGNNSIKIIGNNYFCPNLNCDFEFDTNEKT